MQGKDITTEQKILEIAEKLFKEKGFAMTSTVEIARMAGCNQSLVHYYYRSKEKLFEKVFEKIAHLFLSVFLQIDEQNLPFEERLSLKIESHFDVLAANPRLPFFFFNEILTNPGRLNKIKEKISDVPQVIIQRMQNDMEREFAKGTIREMNAIDLVMTVISLNVMLFMAKPLFQMITGIPDGDYEKFIIHRRQEHVNIILKSLRP